MVASLSECSTVWICQCMMLHPGGYKDRNASEGWGEREYTVWMCVMLELVAVKTGMPVKVGERGEDTVWMCVM